MTSNIFVQKRSLIKIYPKKFDRGKMSPNVQVMFWHLSGAKPWGFSDTYVRRQS